MIVAQELLVTAIVIIFVKAQDLKMGFRYRESERFLLTSSLYYDS